MTADEEPRPRISPLRVAALSLAALAAALAAGLGGRAGEAGLLPWILALVPAFLLAEWKGWKGVALSMALGMVGVAAAHLGSFHAGTPSPAPVPFLVGIALFVTCGLAWGWTFEDRGVAVRQRALLRREVDWSRAVFEGSRDAVFVSAPDASFVRVNRAAEELTGYTRDELLAMRIPDLHDDLDLEAFRAYHDRIFAGEDAVTEAPLRRKDGTRVDVEFSNSRIEIAGRPCMLTTARNVTERNERARELLRSEYRFEAFMERLPGGAFIREPGGAYLHPLAPDATRRERPGTRVPGAGVLEATRARDAEVVARGRPLTYTLPGARGHDRLHWEVHHFPFADPDGERSLVGGIVLDATERTRLEEQLRHAQRAEALGTLAGGIAHDFNNLLSVVLSTAELLEGGAIADDERAAHVRIIRNAARSGAELVRKLMALGRRRPLELVPLDVGRAVEDLRDTLRRVLPETIDIRISGQEDVPAVLADASCLQQILLNLASNARDAMPQGGTLEISVETADRPGGPTGDGAMDGEAGHVLLRVTDTGTGMDAETLRRVFLPFFTTKEAARGTGLGLPMVQGLVRQHGGSVEIESEPGTGTELRVFLPAATGPAVSPTPAEEQDGPTVRTRDGALPPRAKRGETVLVVDDDADLRQAAARVLESLGYRTECAADGREALTTLTRARDRVHAILSDVVMPGMGGPELLQRLRADGVTVPFLLTTGYGSGEGALAGGGPAGARVIRKPWTVEELAVSIREALDGG